MAKEQEGNVIKIEVCSNCNSHSWCTRHDEAAYLKLANELKDALASATSQWSTVVNVVLVSGSKMGSFEVSIGSNVLFSKLALGYFPHVTLLTERVVQYFQDVDGGMDPCDFQKKNYSPVKQHPQLALHSPKKKAIDPKSPYLKGSPNASKIAKPSPTANHKKEPVTHPKPACSSPQP